MKTAVGPRGLSRIHRTIATLVLGTVAGGLGLFAAGQTPGKSIVIWKVGDPFDQDTPANTIPGDLASFARQAGLEVQMRTFPARGFYESFTEAQANRSGPDILAIINFSILVGAEQTPAGAIRGIAPHESDAAAFESVQGSLDALEPPPERGWVFLLRNSPNYAAARDLVQKMAVVDNVRTEVRGSFDPNDVARIQEQALSATRNYLEADRAAMQKISDAQSLAVTRPLLQPSARSVSAGAAQVVRIHGNRNLAFVSIRSSFGNSGGPSSQGGPGALGTAMVFSVFRKDSGTWKLLTISRDPALGEVMESDVPRLAALLSDDKGTNAPNPAKLITADGVFPQPANPNAGFGDFAWTPSSSPDVVCEIVEFYYGPATRFFLFFDRPASARISTGMLLSGLSWRWRVWSVSRSGMTAFSETRAFDH